MKTKDYILQLIDEGGTEYTIKAYDGKTVLASNDGNEQNSITLNVVSDFGEI